jgi:HlyD family secretion protein
MKPLFLFSKPLKWTLAGMLLAALLLPRGSAVQVVPVQRQDLLQSVVATGRLNAPARIELAAEVTAAVSAVLVREGDHVKAGQLLLQLSNAEAQAALQQARAAWLEARSRATQQATVAAPVSTQSVVQTRAAFHAAELEHQRTRELVAQGFFPQQKLDESRRTLDTAASALQSAQVQAAPTSRPAWKAACRPAAWRRPARRCRWPRPGWRAWRCAARSMQSCWRATSSPAAWPSPAACCWRWRPKAASA